MHSDSVYTPVRWLVQTKSRKQRKAAAAAVKSEYVLARLHKELLGLEYSRCSASNRSTLQHFFCWLNVRHPLCSLGEHAGVLPLLCTLTVCTRLSIGWCRPREGSSEMAAQLL